jgi:Flp pilus assembly protein TadD
MKFIFLLFISLISSSLSFAYDLDTLAELIQKGKESEAIQRVNEYIQKYPNDPELKFLCGATLNHFGKTREAKDAFLDLSNKYPNNAVIKNNLGVLYAKLGEYRKAVFLFESALKLKTDYQEPKSNLSLIQKLDRVYLTSK